jgi:TonB family protein
MPDRLTIRIKLPPREEQPPAPARRRLSKGALLLILGVVAVVLGAIGVSMFRTEPTPAPAASQSPVPEPAPREVAPVVETKPVEPPVEPEVQTQPPLASPSASVNEVVPDVPLSARQTISGTIRVSVRVIVAKDGTVVAATADEPGPSRYFERLSLEAARQWTFAPADSEKQRVVMVRFYFKRSGTTARASPLQ